LGISIINITLTIIATHLISNWSLWHAFAFGAYVIVMFAALFYVANINLNRN
jgi:hypothetical protein